MRKAITNSFFHYLRNVLHDVNHSWSMVLMTLLPAGCNLWMCKGKYLAFLLYLVGIGKIEDFDGVQERKKAWERNQGNAIDVDIRIKRNKYLSIGIHTVANIFCKSLEMYT